MGTNLPIDIDATFPDRDPGDAEHQRHHDALHAYTNQHDTATDPHAQYHNDARGDARYFTQAQAAAKYGATRAKVRPGADVTLPNNTFTVINHTVEYFDVSGLHSSTANTDRITLSKSGLWMIVGHIITSGGTAAGRRIVLVYQNGAEVGRDTRFPSTTATANSTATAFVDAAAGDYVHMSAYQDSGGSVTLTAATSYFLAVYLGE